jgi:hypothetical protein
MSWFYEIRSSNNLVLKRNGGFASQDAAKTAGREDAKKMRHTLRILCLFTICLIARRSVAQSRLPGVSLCDLQTRVAQGERWNIQVEGVYLNGSNAHYLVAPVCAGLGTRIAFELRTQRNWKRLVRKSANHKGTLVVFDGEFYGSPTANAKQPEATQTKMVVHSILRVKTLPSHYPCTPPKYDRTQSPCFQGDLIAQDGDAVNP